MARKRKKQPKHESPGMAKLKRELLRDGLVVDVRQPPPEEPKLSAALIELVSPFAPYAKTLREYKMLIGIGVTAWNLPLLEGPEREAFYKQLIQPLLESGDKQMRLEAKEMFSTLLKRREQNYPDDKRLIVNYTVTENGDEYNVAVATVLHDLTQGPKLSKG
jgi:hypothetical protein